MLIYEYTLIASMTVIFDDDDDDDDDEEKESQMNLVLFSFSITSIVREMSQWQVKKCRRWIALENAWERESDIMMDNCTSAAKIFAV